MKPNLALLTGVIVLGAATAVASQPAQAPAGQSINQTQGTSKTQAPAANPKGAPDADSSCDATDKSTTADTKAAHPSARVGKDTGDLPPPRKKASNNATCRTQPQ